jgi:cation:H+ antiporter
MELPITLFVIGVILLLVCTQAFVKLAERISASLKLSPLIIGLTIVSIGTSLPELTVSTIAVIRGDTGLAMGNIIGSNIVNVLLVLGVGIFTGKLFVGTTKTQRNIWMMAGITGLFLFFYFIKFSSLLTGGVLLSLVLFVTLEEYVLGVNGRNHEDARFLKKRKIMKFSVVDTGKLIGAIAGIVIGGLLTVASVEQLSVLMGISATVLGLSVTAIATSLPELLTTIFSEVDHEEKITIGNLIGSNIYNLTLIGGLVLFLTSWNAITSYEIIMLITSTLAFTGIIAVFNGRIIPKYIGFLLLILFCIYIYFLR